MLAKERLYNIMNRLNVQPFITIQELCDDLNVSTSTVHRDLIALEKEGKIVRDRGGVIQKRMNALISVINEAPVLDKVAIHNDEKSRICRQAAQFIKEGDCIFIDTGTTVTGLLPFIENKKITLVTNSIYLVNKLSKMTGNVFLVGGNYSIKYLMNTGSFTIDELRRFKFDACFLSANGVDVNRGETYVSEFDAGSIKRTVMERSTQKFLLVDSSKFEVTGIFNFSSLNAFTHVITDKSPSGLHKPENLIIC